MRKFILYTFMLLLLSFGMVQKFEYRVLANKGSNTVVRDANTITVKTGMPLYSTDVLKTSKQSYLGLMHKTGRTLEIRGEISTKVSKLKMPSQESIASRYAAFIASKMQDDNNSFASRMNATGAVSRALGDAIMLHTPDVAYIYGDIVWVNWSTDAPGPYRVTYGNIFDEELKSFIISDTVTTLDFDWDLYNNDLITIKITSDSVEVNSVKTGFKKLKDPQLIQKIQNLEKELPKNSILNRMIWITFWEENGLIQNATSDWINLLRYRKDDFYIQEYYSFLTRNGLL